jgi:hypothetical protein
LQSLLSIPNPHAVLLLKSLTFISPTLVSQMCHFPLVTHHQLLLAKDVSLCTTNMSSNPIPKAQSTCRNYWYSGNTRLCHFSYCFLFVQV